MNSINIFFICSLFLISSFEAQTNFQPKALILPVTKDPAPTQYVTRIHQRTPLVPLRLTLDLGGQFMWVDCQTNYISKTYNTVQCGSPQCSLAKARSCTFWCPGPPRPGCSNNSCTVMADHYMAGSAINGDLGSDVIAIQSTDGNNPGHRFSVHDFLFGCQSSVSILGLASGVAGMAGLGRTSISLPSQFSSAFRFRNVFALCLSPSLTSPGVVFFGDGPYRFMSITDASSNLTYTPLIKNPVNTPSPWTQGVASSEYYIGVTSIRINDKIVPINKTLLTINRDRGGTKISTVHPYMELERSIYKAVIEAFDDALSGVDRVAYVLPFGLCYNSTGIGSTRVGPAVPRIDLVLQNDDVLWRMFGANSMVQVSEDVLCLGFVDAGVSPMSSIVIGGHQIEDNLLQFDLARSRLGFSSSLLSRQTTCANFNFTSNT